MGQTSEETARAAGAAPAGTGHPCGPLVLAAVAVLALTAPVVGDGAPGTSGTAVTRSVDGTPGVDLRAVGNVYRGRVVDLATVERLNADGRAMAGVASHELGCQGVMLWFDTAEQADAYGRGYLARLRVREGEPRDATGDPCADVADAPDFRPAR